MSNVAIKNMFTGICQASIDAGRHPGWANAKLAALTIEKVAGEWTGPETLGDAALPKEAALQIEARLVGAAQALAKAGHAPVPRAKTASVEDLHGSARASADFWVDAHLAKAASGPGSLTDAGPNTLESAKQTDQLSELGYPEGAYVLPGRGAAAQGKPSMLAEPGIVGREIPHPDGPSISPNINNSLTRWTQKAAEGPVSPPGLGGAMPPGGPVSPGLAGAMPVGTGASGPVSPPMSGPGASTGGGNLGRNLAMMGGAGAVLGGAALLYHHLTSQGVPEPQAQAIAQQADAAPAAPMGEEHVAAAMATLNAASQAAVVKAASFGGVAAQAATNLLAARLRGPGLTAANTKIAGAAADYVRRTATSPEDAVNRALGYKQADEDTQVADLCGGATPGGPPSESAEHESAEMGLLQQIWDKLQQMCPDSDEAATATAGLMDQGPEGHQVLASIVGPAKTAAEVDAGLRATLTQYPGLAKVASLDTWRFVTAGFKAAGDKTATLLGYLKRASGPGSLTDVGPNTETDAKKNDELAALDLTTRPEGYAMPGGQGKSDLKFPVPEGRIEPANRPGVPQVAGDNVVTRADKQAADAAYTAALTKIAQEFGPYIPTTLADDQKLAWVRDLYATSPSGRVERLRALRGETPNTRQA